jgi:cytochrome c oxidase assembly protein Cox11
VTTAKLHTLTADQLTTRFAELGIAQDEAEDNNAEYSRIFREMQAVKEELKSRPGDQRRILLALYDHPNTQVRLMAAKATLAVAPEQARRMIESIAASRAFPQAGDAGMCLTMLDRGIFVPE